MLSIQLQNKLALDEFVKFKDLEILKHENDDSVYLKQLPTHVYSKAFNNCVDRATYLAAMNEEAKEEHQRIFQQYSQTYQKAADRIQELTRINQPLP